MRNLINLFTKKEFVQFLVVSGFAAIVNFSSRILLSFLFSLPTSIVVAYVIGMIVAFLLNKWFVFKPQQAKNLTRFLVFLAVNLVAILQTLVVTMILVKFIFPTVGYTFYPEETAHFIGIGVPVFTSYLGHKFFTFSKLKMNG